MFGRIKRWWNSNAMLLLGQGIIGIVPLFLRLQEIGASPKKRARIEQFRQQHYAMRQQLNKINASADRDRQDAPDDASIKMLERLEDFNKEHAPEELEKTRRWKQDAINRKQERAAMELLRKNAGEDTTKLIHDLREYRMEHPQSVFAQACLIGALRQAAKYDEALALARERLQDKDEDDNYGIGRFSAMTTIAAILTQKGEPREAVFLLEKLLAEYPDLEGMMRVTAYMELAEAYEKSNNHEEARKNWKRVVSYGEYKQIAKHAKERLKSL